MGRNQSPNPFHIIAAQRSALDHPGNEHSRFLADPFSEASGKFSIRPNLAKGGKQILRDGVFLYRYPDTSYLATIILSLPDKIHPPAEAFD
jgi:hypothetical protein